MRALCLKQAWNTGAAEVYIGEWIISALEERDVCGDAIAWLRSAMRTVEELVDHYPGVAVWIAVNLDLPDKLADRLYRLTGWCSWWKDGKRHREYGPAVVWDGGQYMWYRHGLLHREGGPAAIYSEHHKEWWRNGVLHRDDGPAVIFPDGRKQWWHNGIMLKEE